MKRKRLSQRVMCIGALLFEMPRIYLYYIYTIACYLKRTIKWYQKCYTFDHVRLALIPHVNINYHIMNNDTCVIYLQFLAGIIIDFTVG